MKGVKQMKELLIKNDDGDVIATVFVQELDMVAHIKDIWGYGLDAMMKNEGPTPLNELEEV